MPEYRQRVLEVKKDSRYVDWRSVAFYGGQKLDDDS